MNFIMMPIPEDKFTAVCALLGGVSGNALTSSARTLAVGASTADARPVTGSSSEQLGTQAENLASAGNGSTATTDASLSDGTLDAAGWPWSPDLHASTKGMTKDGLWRMKVGVSRPDPKPGFPKDDASGNGATGTPSNGAASDAGGTASSAGAGPATNAVEDEDEFAAFRAAADKAGATDAAAAASVPARKWTDADLGALCNQAAVKFGDPAPVKAIIQKFVPADAVPHSRNILDDKREEFAKAVEAAAEITFAG